MSPALAFLADLHLSGDGDPAAERFGRFLDSLAAPGSGTAALYVLGDLFESWVERGTRTPKRYAGVLAGIARATAAGLAVRVLPGNRDFFLGRAFAAATGAEVLPERAEISLAGKRALLVHGDLLVAGDTRYRLWRAVSRSAVSRFFARRLPFALAERIASRLARRGGLLHREGRPEGLPLSEARLALELARGYDLILCGHLHRFERRAIPAAGGRTGELVALPSWREKGEHIVFEGGDLALRNFA